MVSRIFKIGHWNVCIKFLPGIFVRKTNSPILLTNFKIWFLNKICLLIYNKSFSMFQLWTVGENFHQPYLGIIRGSKTCTFILTFVYFANLFIFSGNLYELGGFSQCLNIKRDGHRYKTQYCLGQLIFELNGDIMSILNTNGESIISPEYLFPQ